MKRMRFVAVLVLVLSLMLALPAHAEGAQGLQVWTRYPGLVVGPNDVISFDLTLSTDGPGETVALSMDALPEGWEADFRGGGHVVQSVYVRPDMDASVDLRLTPPDDVQAGVYEFTVIAQGETSSVRLPLQVTIKEKLPPKLQFSTDLPTLRGTPKTSFRYSLTLKNTGDEDATVNLVADAGGLFDVQITYSGKQVTSLPLEAGSSKMLSVEAKAVGEIPAGDYPITIQAQGESAQAEIDLTAEVTGQSQLMVTTSDGRLSGRATAGKETPLKIIVRNDGTAPARDVQLTSSAPSGWKVSFDPQQIAEIAAGDQAEVTVNIVPAEKALAGDYMLTLRAKPSDGATQSADFRLTVTTSTLWGVIGVLLIAAAVVVVGMAVMRFGRR